MPKLKQIDKFKHPNSRKTKALVKSIKKQKARQKNKFASNIKINLVGEKIKWFQDHLDPSVTAYMPFQTHELILKYLSRFDEELEQIKLKHSIGNRKNRQHASREDIIKMTVNRELEEFNSCGLEIPDLSDPVQFKFLKEWNGELRFINNFKLKRFNPSQLKHKSNATDKQKSEEISTNDLEMLIET